VPFDPQATKNMTGIKAITAPQGYDPVTANGLLPTIQVSGINSGYTANGYKNIIPGAAIIKINFRFGP
jgi:acetylornithine deacetylase/succinyl-diaminopimelate desuccinylase-like protein